MVDDHFCLMDVNDVHYLSHICFSLRSQQSRMLTLRQRNDIVAWEWGQAVWPQRWRWAVWPWGKHPPTHTHTHPPNLMGSGNLILLRMLQPGSHSRSWSEVGSYQRAFYCNSEGEAHLSGVSICAVRVYQRHCSRNLGCPQQVARASGSIGGGHAHEEPMRPLTWVFKCFLKEFNFQRLFRFFLGSQRCWTGGIIQRFPVCPHPTHAEPTLLSTSPPGGYICYSWWTHIDTSVSPQVHNLY